ncbi:MAG TPA: dCTP deaminase [candidate division Zixibacteria bacterium]|nr:dCTP deaminase [candidate division Zixibacteria bacterium]
MPVKSDRWIIEMAKNHKMIEPFSETQVRQGCSFGVSSYGYDISLSDEFKIFDPRGLSEVNPKEDFSEHFRDIKADSVLIPPNSFILGRTREYFKIPRDVVTVCFGKSTYARCGVVVNVTPFEPEWEGFATISLSNTTPLPARVFANEGIAQILFLEAAESCLRSYKDKKGKYQGQKEITLSKSE